jgi:predicted transcriptional regulator
MEQAHTGPYPVRIGLGPLEHELLRIVCESGCLSARQVQAKLSRRAAYTTVMTTLVKLHQKGFLARKLSGRAYLYSSCVSGSELETQFARELLVRFLSCSQMPLEQKISMLHDALLQLEKLRAESLPTRQPDANPT